MSQHINAMTAGTFDGGYTLEPNASMMIKAGVARSLEAGVISKYILGDEAADAYAAGCAMTSDFIQKRPDVAKRFAARGAKPSISSTRTRMRRVNIWPRTLSRPTMLSIWFRCSATSWPAI